MVSNVKIPANKQINTHSCPQHTELISVPWGFPWDEEIKCIILHDGMGMTFQESVCVFIFEKCENSVLCGKIEWNSGRGVN